MFFLLSLLVGYCRAAPYKIVVTTDAGAQARAREFIQRLSQTEPFRQLIAARGVEVVAAPVVLSNLNCHGGALGIARLADCQLGGAREACRGADLCPVFTSVPNIGAGGPFTPVASSSFPWTTMLHEVVHTFGFTDEYAYTHSEVGTYCGNSNDWTNGHSDSRPNSFSSEAEAKRSCVQRVPWCQAAIDAGATVVQRNSNGSFTIGSPTPSEGCPNVTLGVYAGGSCQNLHPQSTWRPYYCPSVMGFPDLGEETCGVARRHNIISRSPNLVPPLYQRRIFELIKQRKHQSDLNFQATPSETAAAGFQYGMPLLDRRDGNTSSPDVCRDGPIAPPEARDLLDQMNLIRPPQLNGCTEEGSGGLRQE